MAAVASSSQPALYAAPATQMRTHPQPSPPRLLLRLPPEPEIDGRRHPLKRKWRSIVNFFALPIRSYYLEPPGVAYRNQLRARRANPWDDEPNSFWPCPAYTHQVGDDEMVLFKAQEEAEALAAMQRDQREQHEATRAQEQVQAQVSSLQTNHGAPNGDDGQGGHEVEQLALSDETLPIAMPIAAPADPSPQYQPVDPLSTFVSASSSPSAAQHVPTPQRPRLRMRTRTSSNLSPPSHQPSFSNGITMSRQHSTPLSPTISSLPSSPSLSRRSRAQTSAVRPAISEPLGWTLVRSQYSYPKRGLTAEQMAFLSSVESLGRFGVGSEVSPSPAYEREDREGASDYGFPSVERG